MCTSHRAIRGFGVTVEVSGLMSDGKNDRLLLCIPPRRGGLRNFSVASMKYCRLLVVFQTIFSLLLTSALTFSFPRLNSKQRLHLRLRPEITPLCSSYNSRNEVHNECPRRDFRLRSSNSDSELGLDYSQQESNAREVPVGLSKVKNIIAVSSCKGELIVSKVVRSVHALAPFPSNPS